MPDFKLTITRPPKDVKEKGFPYMLTARTAFHICACADLTFVSIYGLYVVFGITEKQAENLSVRDAKRFVAFYGTNWTLTVQSIFFSLSLLYNLLQWCDKDSTHFGKLLRYWRDVIFSGMMFPFTLFVTSMFWSVYFIDRELVLPKVFDEIIHPWFNHFLHTYTSLYLLIETVLQPRRKPVDKKMEMILLWTISITYFVFYYCIRIFAGRWLYGVFGVLNWWQLVLFQTLIFSLMYIYYKMQFPINRMFHRRKTESPKPAQVHTAQVGLTPNGAFGPSLGNADSHSENKTNGETK